MFVQLRYLFGGSEQVISEATGLTFAQYARRGFVELLITSFLVIGLSIVMLGVVDRGKLKKESHSSFLYLDRTYISDRCICSLPFTYHRAVLWTH